MSEYVLDAYQFSIIIARFLHTAVDRCICEFIEKSVCALTQYVYQLNKMVKCVHTLHFINTKNREKWMKWDLDQAPMISFQFSFHGLRIHISFFHSLHLSLFTIFVAVAVAAAAAVVFL